MSEISLKLTNTASAEPVDPGGKVSSVEPTKLGGTTPEIVLEIQPPEAQADSLSPADWERLREFKEQIDLSNSSTIVCYGKKAQEYLKTFTSDTLASTMRIDTESIGQYLTELAASVGNFVKSGRRGRWLGKFGADKRLVALREEYTETARTVERLKKSLDGQRLGLQNHCKMLESYHQQVLKYCDELSLRIVAGRQWLEEQNSKIAELHQKATVSQSAEDIALYNDCQNRCESFVVRLQDLELTKTISLQLIAQIQLALRNIRALMLKIESSINNTIPIWQQSVAMIFSAQYDEEVFKASNNELLVAIDELIKLAKEDCESHHQNGEFPQQGKQASYVP